MSVPGVTGWIDRPGKLKLKALDLDGQEVTLEAEDYFARAICHEVDHLDGVLFIDRADFGPDDDEHDDLLEEHTPQDDDEDDDEGYEDEDDELPEEK